MVRNGLICGLLVALLVGPSALVAQAPPPVPALPDAQRLTTYSLSASTCACSVGFQIYGDGTDVDQWIDVFVNGVSYQSGDPMHGWSLSSVTGTLGSIPRPITNAILTFNSPQTGSVSIVGARRPRRASQFPENRGVSAREINQVITDLTATQRELWDQGNRTIRGQPGEFFNPLPPPASRAGTILTFDASGAPVPGLIGAGMGNVSGPVSSTNGDLACWVGTSGRTLTDCGAQTGCPNIAAFGGKGDNSTDNAPAFNAAIAATKCIYFPVGKYRFNSTPAAWHATTGTDSLVMKGDGADATELYFPSVGTGFQIVLDTPRNSVHLRDFSITTGQNGLTAGGGYAISITQLGGNQSPAYDAPNDITGVTIRGEDGYFNAGNNYWFYGVVINNKSNINWINDYIQGPGASGFSTVGTGVVVQGVNVATCGVGSTFPVAHNFIGTWINLYGVGVEIGQCVQGMAFTSANFTGGNIGIHAANGIEGFTEMSVIGSQFGMAFMGIQIESTLNNFTIMGNTFYVTDHGSGGVGVDFPNTTAGSFVISGNNFNLIGSGILNGVVSNQVTATWPGVITGNVFYNSTVNNGVGIFLQSGSANNLVYGNSFFPGLTRAVVNDGTNNVVVLNFPDSGYLISGTGTIAGLTCGSGTAGMSIHYTNGAVPTYNAPVTIGVGSGRAVCDGVNWNFH